MKKPKNDDSKKETVQKDTAWPIGYIQFNSQPFHIY